MRTKITLLISLLLLASLLTACGGVAFAAEPGQAAPSEGAVTRTLNTSGTGKAYLTPDIAYINIGVHTEGKSAAEAVAANTALSSKVVDSLKAEGIDAKDIQTTNFSIYPQPKYDDKGQPTGEITYIVDNTVYVTVRDITKVGAVLDAAVTAGANNVYGIQFDAADKTAALSEARKQAVDNAEIAAKELADAAGVTLGPIQTISSYSGSPVPVYEGKGGGAAVMDASVPVSPGQMVISVDVSMVYEIR